MTGLSRRAMLLRTLAATAAAVTGHRSGAQTTSSLPWRNWSGGQSSTPAGRFAPASEEALQSFLATTHGALRPVGAGHSFSGLVPTNGHLVVLDRIAGLTGHDAASATFGAGTRLSETGPVLEAIGQALNNLPDIDRQTLAGAIATGTHGTGYNLTSLAAQSTGIRLIAPDGTIHDLERAKDEALFRAAQVSLGALGLVTQVRMQTRAAYRLKERSWTQPTEEVLEDFETKARTHRHFEMFPLTHSKYASVLAIDETDDPIDNPPVPEAEAAASDDLMRNLQNVPPMARQTIIDAAVADTPASPSIVDASYKVLANVRNYRFNEMEYSVPIEAGAACLREILKTISDDNIDVVFPLEYRYVAGDDAWLSMFHGGPRASISIHRDARFDYRPYFDAIEPIFWKYEAGRTGARCTLWAIRNCASSIPASMSSAPSENRLIRKGAC